MRDAYIHVSKYICVYKVCVSVCICKYQFTYIQHKYL